MLRVFPRLLLTKGLVAAESRCPVKFLFLTVFLLGASLLVEFSNIKPRASHEDSTFPPFYTFFLFKMALASKITCTNTNMFVDCERENLTGLDRQYRPQSSGG
jgi:hypothetical protein